MIYDDLPLIDLTNGTCVFFYGLYHGKRVILFGKTYCMGFSMKNGLVTMKNVDSTNGTSGNLCPLFFEEKGLFLP